MSSNFEIRQIKGWRTRMEEKAAELRRAVWEAPANTTYLPDKQPRRYDDLEGHQPWHKRVFGPERKAASAALEEHQGKVRLLRYTERTEEQRLAVKLKYANLTLDQRQPQNKKLREWRAQQSDAWRRNEAEMKRHRRAARPELYREIDRTSKLRTREASNARKRAAYAMNRELHRQKCRDYRARKRVEREMSGAC